MQQQSSKPLMRLLVIVSTLILAVHQFRQQLGTTLSGMQVDPSITAIETTNTARQASEEIPAAAVEETNAVADKPTSSPLAIAAMTSTINGSTEVALTLDATVISSPQTVIVGNESTTSPRASGPKQNASASIERNTSTSADKTVVVANKSTTPLRASDSITSDPVKNSSTVVHTSTSSTSTTAPVNESAVLTVEQRFSKYIPNLEPVSDFDRKRMGKLPETSPLKVKTPIFLASLPKSGTSSIWKYFLCGGHMAAHAYSRANRSTAYRIGECMEMNINASRKPFQDCGPYYVWTDNGWIDYHKDKKSGDASARCYYPSIHSLDALYQAYPEMTILLVRREPSSWMASVSHWAGISERWPLCKRHGMPVSESEEALQEFYESHTTRIRQFAADHPTITYIEVPLEGEDVGKKLEAALGPPASCWKKCQASKKHCLPA